MCMSIKDYMSKEQLENYNNNDVTQERIGGMKSKTVFQSLNVLFVL